MEGLIRLNKVKEMTTLSTATIYRLIDKGEFPLRLNIGLRKVFWVEQEIKDYLAKKLARRY